MGSSISCVWHLTPAGTVIPAAPSNAQAKLSDITLTLVCYFYMEKAHVVKS